jgi:cytochrome d ubiquinol oxidase subunit I
MDPVLLARIQFALTIGFHFLFPPLTIGLAWIIFYFMNRRTGERACAIQARFWTKLFAISFVLGVATGITMEFQSGTNWAGFARFIGPMAGGPLAAEGVLAFFLESTFMGVLLFGWGRLSDRILWLASLLVAVGATLSGFMIIVVNSWMHTPAGFEIDPATGRAVLTDLWAAVFNPSTLPRFLHTIDGAIVTGSFFVMGISAWYLCRGRFEEFARRSLQVALVFALVSSVLQVQLGHFHGHQVWKTQPAKMAAYEGLFESERNPMLMVFGFIDAEEGKVHFPIGIPSFMSIFLDYDPDTVIQGLNEFPRENWPPLPLTFYPFHLMTLLGFYFVGLAGLGVLLWWRGKLFGSRWFLTLAYLSIPLPFAANDLGWMATEVGRQPWVVYGVEGMRTALVASPSVSAGEILASLAMFVIVYASMFALWLFLIGKVVGKGPDPVGGGSPLQARGGERSSPSQV